MGSGGYINCDSFYVIVDLQKYRFIVSNVASSRISSVSQSECRWAFFLEIGWHQVFLNQFLINEIALAATTLSTNARKVIHFLKLGNWILIVIIVRGAYSRTTVLRKGRHVDEVNERKGDCWSSLKEGPKVTLRHNLLVRWRVRIQ